MATVKRDTREVLFKIVYCGPPSGGKTTNLYYIHRRLDPRWRGDLVSVATERNRTLMFDFLPVAAAEIGGYRVRFQLYTVPGQEVMREARRSVLAGADGVVFVADSDPARSEANRISRDDCRGCLVENGLDPERTPLVHQFNKRDLADAVRPEDMDEQLAVTGPSFLACATSGYQVFATLDSVTQRVLQEFCVSNVPREGPPARSGAEDRPTAGRPAPTAHSRRGAVLPT